MKKPKQQKTQQINQDLAKVRAILRHVRNVHEACLLLGERLIERGESQHEMPRWAVAEMICDWKSRSEEFGTSLHAYIKENATERWHFSERDPIYRTIMEFVNMLCDKPFARL